MGSGGSGVFSGREGTLLTGIPVASERGRDVLDEDFWRGEALSEVRPCDETGGHEGRESLKGSCEDVVLGVAGGRLDIGALVDEDAGLPGCCIPDDGLFAIGEVCCRCGDTVVRVEEPFWPGRRTRRPHRTQGLLLTSPSVPQRGQII